MFSLHCGLPERMPEPAFPRIQNRRENPLNTKIGHKPE